MPVQHALHEEDPTVAQSQPAVCVPQVIDDVGLGVQGTASPHPVMSSVA
jgi:hypothetical protein